jgi:hypothetical protein
MVYPDDTRHCPIGPECEGCGRLDELAVVTGEGADGVLYMTLCDACEVAGVLPILSPPGEATRVREHAHHVGMEVD